MAQKTLVQLVDDLDGGEADETVSFTVDGTSYEIDLNDKNAARLRDAFAPFIGAARKSSGRRGTRGPARVAGGRATGSDRQRTQDIRAWAKQQGKNISDRGRIPAGIVDEYDAAH